MPTNAARHVMMQANDGPQLRALLERPAAFGVTRVVFPAREYGKRRAGRNSLYETALLLPRGDDGGFAERFLQLRRGRAT